LSERKWTTDRFYLKLVDAFNRIENIESKVKQLEEHAVQGSIPAPVQVDLPDHLRRSYMAVYTLGICTAADVSAVTKRARAVESAYLNYLCTLRMLKKWRKGRNVNFAVKEQGGIFNII
jgi:hypothetical protein